MNRTTVISLFAALAVAACSKTHEAHDTEAAGKQATADERNPVIDFVKEQASKAEGLTYGQVLDNSPNCASREWSDDKDKYGRDIVAFHCVVKISPDRIEAIHQSAIGIVQRDAGMQASLCSVDATPYVNEATQKLGVYYDRFKSLTEVMEFVVNQGQVVETHAGIFDQNGTPLTLNSYGINLVASDLQSTGDGKQEAEHVYSIVADGSPRSLPNCYFLKQALEHAGSTGASVGQPPASGNVTFDAGDIEPEPKSQ